MNDGAVLRNKALRADNITLSKRVRLALKQQAAKNPTTSTSAEMAVRDVDKVGSTGTTALIMVCTKGTLEEAKALVEACGTCPVLHSALPRFGNKSQTLHVWCVHGFHQQW